jgi:pimeloyl-ACP methyl ester carboxylesterase
VNISTSTSASTCRSMTAPRRRRLPLLGLVLVAALLAGGLTACFPSVGTNFPDPGPYAEISVQKDADHWIYHPNDLGRDGLLHPVVLWGNGTWLNPEHYEPLLQHLAKQGFIVAAAFTSNAGSGREMLAGLDKLTRLNEDSESPFYRHVDVGTVASMGHSQGGGGALQAAHDPRVDTVVALEPFMGNAAGVHGPAFFVAGERDTTIPPASVRQRYTASTAIPAAYGEFAGADHITPALDAGAMRGPITAWLRWHLMVDAVAKRQFVGNDCAYCTSDVFRSYETNARLQSY